MQVKDFVSIYLKCGYTIKKINGYYFLNHGLINYSFPKLMEIPLNKRLINTLKWRYLITVIKTNFRIKNTHEFILSTKFYGIESFRKRTRTTVRKSLTNCEFKKPDLKDILQVGLSINRQTLKLQNRKDKFLTDPKLWEKYISLIYDHEDSIIMGAYFNGQMIGYAVAYELEGMHYFDLQHIDRNYSTYYSMNGLMYTIVNQLISQNGSVKISDGIDSFYYMPSLNRFKTCMQFQRVPITRTYILHPILLAIIKLVIFYYIRILRKKSIHNQWVRQLISLYQGHRLLCKIIAESPIHVFKAKKEVCKEYSS